MVPVYSENSKKVKAVQICFITLSDTVPHIKVFVDGCKYKCVQGPRCSTFCFVQFLSSCVISFFYYHFVQTWPVVVSLRRDDVDDKRGLRPARRAAFMFFACVQTRSGSGVQHWTTTVLWSSRHESKGRSFTYLCVSKNGWGLGSSDKINALSSFSVWKPSDQSHVEHHRLLSHERRRDPNPP